MIFFLLLLTMLVGAAISVTPSSSFVLVLPTFESSDLMMCAQTAVTAYAILFGLMYIPYGSTSRALGQDLLLALTWLFSRIILAYFTSYGECNIGDICSICVICVYGYIAFTTLWSKATASVLCISLRLLARLCEPWPIPPGTFVFVFDLAKVMRNRRALRLRFVHPRKHLKHGLTVSCEEYWDAPEDFIDSTESSTILSSAPLDKGPKKLPDTLPPVLYPCAILGAPEIAPSGDMSDVAASRRPCLSATDHESKQVECDRAAPSILTKNNAAPVSEDDQSEIYSARSNVLGPRASLSSVFSSSTNTSLEPSLFDEDTAPESPNASIFAESPSKPETPIELQPEGKPALRWNFATIRRSPAPHDFKLPSNFSLSMSCARFKIKNAPQPKSLEDLPIRSQLYPGVKPCSCECDRDVSSLTAWIAKHNLRRQRKSKSKPEPTTAAAAQTQTAEDAAKSTKKKSARKFKVQLEEVVDVSISGTANTATSWTDVAGTPAPSSFDAFLAEDYGFPAPNLPRKSGSGPRTQPAKEEGKGPSFFDKGKWPAVDLNEARRELFSSGAPMMGRGSDATPMGRSFSQSEAPGPELAPNSPAVPRPPTPVIIPQDEIMTDVRQPTSLEEMTLEPGKPRRVAGRIAGRLAREARADREMS